MIYFEKAVLNTHLLFKASDTRLHSDTMLPLMTFCVNIPGMPLPVSLPLWISCNRFVRILRVECDWKSVTSLEDDTVVLREGAVRIPQYLVTGLYGF